MITVKARARFFSGFGVETLQVMVDEENRVYVWDEIAGYFTSMHSLSPRAEKRIAKLAKGAGK